MKNLTKLLAFLAISALIVAGCQNGPMPLESDNHQAPPLAQLSLPGSAVFDSATLYLNVDEAPNKTVNVHRITDPWDELTVTWNNFSNAFDPAIVGSFVTDGLGWRSVDVTSLVGDWLDGTYDNFGFLLEQGATDFSRYYSSENSTTANRPYLVIWYTDNGSPGSMTIQRGTNGEVADSWVWELLPDNNYGTDTNLWTGLSSIGGVKYTLIVFELPSRPEVAAIGDFVWIDENVNGIQDEGEPGFPDVKVYLYDCDDNLLDSMFTDADGYYLFSGLTPGDYYVKFVEPEGYDFTLQDQGSDDALDSDADPTTGMTICTNLEGGETDLTWDAGLYLVVQEGCSYTIGFWKTHAGFGPQANVVSQFLPIWLGDMGGSKSIEVADSAIAHDILGMHTYGAPSNGVTKLYAQLLGVKLNIANGADDEDVAAVIADADAFLADYDWMDWDSFSKPVKKMVLGWMSTLDDYNNGLIGPGHCD